MRFLGTFYNAVLDITETVNFIAPSIDAVKAYMDNELKNFRKLYEDIPYDEWKETHPDGNMVDFYRTFAYDDYCSDCKYSIISNPEEFNSEAINLDANGGIV